MNTRRIGAGSCVRNAIFALVATMLLASCSTAGQRPSSSSKLKSAGAFETPIKTVTVDLGRIQDPLRSKDHTMLSCYYFPNLLVKELYVQGDIGSEWLSMLRSRNKLPACKPTHAPGERLLKNKEWSGDFWGVKRNLVFFSCDEVQQGDCSFVVYDSTTEKKLFEGDGSLSDKDYVMHMQAFATKAGVVAKYLAAADAGCDLFAKGTGCWRKVVRHQNIWRRLGLRLAECGPHHWVDVKRRACGAASADIRWSVV